MHIGRRNLNHPPVAVATNTESSNMSAVFAKNMTSDKLAQSISMRLKDDEKGLLISIGK